jgi:hypothetical protein
MSGLRQPPEVARRARMAYLVAEAIDEVGLGIRVIADPEQDLEDLGSAQPRADFTVQYLDVRVPLLLLLDLKDGAGFSHAETLQLAWPILKRSPETLAVALVANDEHLSTAIVEPPDSVGAITVPSGDSIGPSLRHHVAPVADALRSFFDSMVPQWGAVESDALDSSAVDSREISRSVAASEANELRAAGARAHIEEKIRNFTALSDRDVVWVANQVAILLSGEAVQLTESIDSQAGAGDD